MKDGRTAKMSMFRVEWYEPEFQTSGTEYIDARTAQQSVDYCRQNCINEGAEITEVSKVVNNWK